MSDRTSRLVKRRTSLLNKPLNARAPSAASPIRAISETPAKRPILQRQERNHAAISSIPRLADLDVATGALVLRLTDSEASAVADIADVVGVTSELVIELEIEVGPQLPTFKCALHPKNRRDRSTFKGGRVEPYRWLLTLQIQPAVLATVLQFAHEQDVSLEVYVETVIRRLKSRARSAGSASHVAIRRWYEQLTQRLRPYPRPAHVYFPRRGGTRIRSPIQSYLPSPQMPQRS